MDSCGPREAREKEREETDRERKKRATREGKAATHLKASACAGELATGVGEVSNELRLPDA